MDREETYPENVSYGDGFAAGAPVPRTGSPASKSLNPEAEEQTADMLKRIQKHAATRLDISDHLTRNDRLAIYKQFLSLENEMILRRHRSGESGLNVALARSCVIDLLLQHLFSQALERFAHDHGVPSTPVCLLGLGGYGRAELSPLSDIDIMFLFPARSRGKHLKTFQELLSNEVLYPLWDLRLKIGHSTRTINEVIEEARKDIRTKTSLLEGRLVAGSEELFNIFHHAYKNFYQKENPHKYLEARLHDQAGRRERFQNTIFLQEPDIKSGVGGLRDYQNTLWMARIKLGIERMADLCEHNYLQHKEEKDYRRAYDFLMRVRNELHFISRHPTDLLDLESQPVVARNLGYEEEDIFKRVEIFMRDYYMHAQTVFRTSQLLEQRLALRQDHRATDRVSFREVIRARKFDRQKQFDGFLLRGNELTFEMRDVFRKDPERLIRVFRHCQQLNCRMDFELTSLIQESVHLITNDVIRSPRPNISFATILQQAGQVYPTLILMHDLGVLGKFVPEFGRLTCLVQHEFYHRYTADIHTLNTLAELDSVFAGEDPVMEKYRAVLRQTPYPKLLYLILFLHDIGKSTGVAGHAESGAKLARNVLTRMEIEEEKCRQVDFVIRNHLLMTRIWQKYDVEDPRTAALFAEQVENLDNLRHLYVHTFCDARATAANLWNSFKDTLHTQLYQSTAEKLTLGATIDQKHTERKKMISKSVIEQKIPGISEEEITAHFNLLPERYFTNTDTGEIILHIKLIHQLLANIAAQSEAEGALIPIIDWNDDVDRSITIVDVVTWDRAGLFSKMAGAFIAAGLNILTAKVITRSDHIAIDTFYVVEPGRGMVQSQEARDTFRKTLERALTSKKDIFPEVLGDARRKKKKEKSLYRQEKPRLEASIPSNVQVYNELSLKRTIVEIQANDKIGLLYEISRILFDYGYDITFARIATERDVALDTFYIENIDPAKGDDETNLLKLQEALSAAIAPE